MSQLGLLISLLVWDNRSISRVIKKIKFRRVVKERVVMDIFDDFPILYLGARASRQLKFLM